MYKTNKIALIYFSRSSKAEAETKSFGNPCTKFQKHALTSFLNRRTTKLLKSQAFDLLFFDEKNQKGNSFGEKLTNAFKATFDLGYEGAISVGNDCIDLDKINFEKIAQRLSQGVNTLGPTVRNGAYLIALTKLSLDKDAFAKLAWQTSELKEDLISYLEGLESQYSILPTFHDVNDIKDLSKIMQSSNLSARIKSILLSFLNFSKEKVDLFFHPLQTSKSFSNIALRAPPTF